MPARSPEENRRHAKMECCTECHEKSIHRDVGRGKKTNKECRGTEGPATVRICYYLSAQREGTGVLGFGEAWSSGRGTA